MSRVEAKTGTFRWTSLVGAALRLRLARRIPQLSNAQFWKRQTASIQRRQLLKLLHTARDTDFGRAKGFGRLAALPEREVLAAYRRAIPVSDWYAYRSMIAEMREGGRPNVLWPGLVRDFAQTSGTTAGDKFIPVSQAMLRSNFLASLDIFANLHRFGVPLPRLTGGRVLF